MIRIGILGAGGIARVMAKTLRGMKEQGRPVELWAVASRDQARADAFAAAEGFSHAFGSYEAMLADPQLDLVYVATPHSHHAAHMKLCIEAGKAVLCEKAFTGNARQAEEVLRLAEEKKVFVTEAIWTRYQPVRKMICDLIASGAIGDVKLLTANLGYSILSKERMFRPDLAGGALLDLGVYTLTFASMYMGDDVVRMESSVEMTETGVDKCETINLYYRNGSQSVLISNMDCKMDRNGVIYGTKGRIVVDNINNPKTVDLYEGYTHVQHFDVPKQITGYEYQVEACIRALESGALECPEMPHAETLHIMRVMDALRAQWNMVYPFD